MRESASGAGAWKWVAVQQAALGGSTPSLPVAHLASRLRPAADPAAGALRPPMRARLSVDRGTASDEIARLRWQRRLTFDALEAGDDRRSEVAHDSCVCLVLGACPDVTKIGK